MTGSWHSSRPIRQRRSATTRTSSGIRYLPQNPGSMNPDGLPVGFVAEQRSGPEMVGDDMRGLPHHRDPLRHHRIPDRWRPHARRHPGSSHGSDRALQQTQNDPAKFARFAATVLGANNTPANQAELKNQLAPSIKTRIGYNLRNFPGYNPTQNPPPPPTRYARLDAVGAIVNEVYYHAVKAANLNSPTEGALPANAPVSYPFLWDTPQHDVVQWLGIAKNGGPLDVFTLSRNVGEVMGVFADFAIPEDPSILNLGYSSSVKIQELGDLEN